jgi:cytochrome P450
MRFTHNEAVSETSTAALARDLLDPANHDVGADPYPGYRQLREQGPVSFVAELARWVVTTYDHGLAVLGGSGWSSDFRNGRAYQAQPDPFPGATELMARVLLFMDPPAHSRVRALVAKAFTPRAVARLRPRIVQLVDHLLQRIEDIGRTELIGDFAFPLTVSVICELLGVRSEDQGLFREQVPKLTTLVEFRQSPQELMDAAVGAFALGAYLDEVFDDRRAHPRGDLISALVQAEEHGDRLSSEELLTTTVLLLAAGHETTMNLIANATLALLRHPDQLHRLREDQRIERNAVEELLRYDSPVQLTARVALDRHIVAGHEIGVGEEAVVLIGAANRDPARFLEPDRLDLARPDVRSLSFGHGAHHCLGAALARLEAEVALPALVRRFPEVRLAAEPTWRPMTTLRGMTALHLDLT